MSTDYVIVSQPAMYLALKMLKRDAEEGKQVRGEVVAEIEASMRPFEQVNAVDEISKIIIDKFATGMNHMEASSVIAAAFLHVVAGNNPHPAFVHAFHTLARRDVHAANSLMDIIKTMENA